MSTKHLISGGAAEVAIDTTTSVTVGSERAEFVIVGREGKTVYFPGSVSQLTVLDTISANTISGSNVTSTNGFTLPTTSDMTAPALRIAGHTDVGLAYDGTGGYLALCDGQPSFIVRKVIAGLASTETTTLFTVAMSTWTMLSFIMHYSITCIEADVGLQVATRTVHVAAVRNAGGVSCTSAESGATHVSLGSLDAEVMVIGESSLLIMQMTPTCNELTDPTITVNVSLHSLTPMVVTWG